MNYNYPSFLFLFVAANLINWLWKGEILFNWLWLLVVAISQIIFDMFTLLAAKSIMEHNQKQQKKNGKENWPYG